MRAERAARAALVAAACASVVAPALAQPTKEDSPRVAQQVELPEPAGETAVSYPEGASGDAEVVLELTIDETGAVTTAKAVRGAAPFAEAAEAAALSWTFRPATRAGVPVAARIRFLVRFVEENAPEPAAPVTKPEPAPEAKPTQSRPRRPPPAEAVEVTVEGERAPPASNTLTRAEVRQLPGAFGDPFRAIEVMPGVTPMATGVPYFFVRGAPPGNVGHFLDGIRVPQLYHVAAGPSVVHPAMVRRVDLYPGGYPARFGRFSGGIVSGETNAPRYDFHGEASLRLVDAGALLEGPFADGRGSALVGGRYSYTGAIVSLLSPDVEVQYWDYQGRAEYRISDVDRLQLFAFGAYDFLGEKTPNGTDVVLATQFHRVDLRWDRALDDGTELRNAITLGEDRTRGDDDAGFVRSRSLRWRSELTHRAGPATWRGGADAKVEWYDLDVVPDPEDLEDTELLLELFPPRRDVTWGTWADVVLGPAPGITVTPGLRVDVFSSAGDTAVGVDPRISARFEVSRRLALLHAFGVVHQPPSFLVPVPALNVSGIQGGLQRSLQYSSGAEWKLPEAITAGVTGFTNVHLNMTDPVGAQRGGGVESERFRRRAIGSTVGVELFAKRALSKRVGGFFSYTLSRSLRSTGREKFPSAFDRTHVLNLALSWKLGNDWRAGSRMSFYTGFPAEEISEGVLRSRHPERVRPFHRLDGRLEKRWRLGRTGYWSFVVEVLNATLSREVVDVTCTDGGNCTPDEIGPVTIPSVGLEAVF